jgi:dihydrofolate reductase
MRKLKLQMQLSIDGFVAGKNGEMDWMVWDWDEELKQYVTEITEPVDCILLGKNLALGFIPHWANVAADPNNPDHKFGKIMHETPKVVFSKTLNNSEWANTIIAGGELIEEITKIITKPGKDIIVYGGAGFVSSLIKHNLIDEYHLFVNPAILGKGIPVFNGVESKLNLSLVKSEAFSCGINLLCYKSL